MVPIHTFIYIYIYIYIYIRIFFLLLSASPVQEKRQINALRLGLLMFVEKSRALEKKKKQGNSFFFFCFSQRPKLRLSNLLTNVDCVGDPSCKCSYICVWRSVCDFTQRRSEYRNPPFFYYYRRHAGPFSPLAASESLCECLSSSLCLLIIIIVLSRNKLSRFHAIQEELSNCAY